MISNEELNRFVLLLASCSLGTNCSKKQVLDCIGNEGWLHFSEHDLKLKSNRNEVVWRNKLAYVRKHLVKEGYYQDGIYDKWLITESGMTYLISLYELLEPNCHSIERVTQKAIDDAHRIIHLRLSIENPVEISLKGKRKKPCNIIPTETEKLMLIKQRVSQVYFKKKLLEYADECKICGLKNPKLLIASHIKPWAKVPMKKGMTLIMAFCFAHFMMHCLTKTLFHLTRTEK